MFWSLTYTLTQRAVDLMLLQLRGDASKDVELLVLGQQAAVLRRRGTWPQFRPRDRVFPGGVVPGAAARAVGAFADGRIRIGARAGRSPGLRSGG
jgi:hypothetical protein